MIMESHYWKDDLLKKAGELRRRKLQRKWPEASFARVEQSIMLGFYSIRKLHEATKLTSAIMSHHVPLVAYPWVGKSVTKLNWHDIDLLYDLNAAKDEEHKLLFVCHQFVHSYIFNLAFDEDNLLEGILFASDHQRHSALLYISIDQVAAIFDQIGNDYPSQGVWKWNPKSNDYDSTLL